MDIWVLSLHFIKELGILTQKQRKVPVSDYKVNYDSWMQIGENLFICSEMICHSYNIIFLVWKTILLQFHHSLFSGSDTEREYYYFTKEITLTMF